jgi:hypothetical protein
MPSTGTSTSYYDSTHVCSKYSGTPREYSGEAEHETRKPNDASGRSDEQKGTGLSIDQGVISELFVELFDLYLSQKKKLPTGLSRCPRNTNRDPTRHSERPHIMRVAILRRRIAVRCITGIKERVPSSRR